MELINRRPARHSPISLTELNAYLDLTGAHFNHVEMERFIALDRAYLAAIPKD